MKHLRFMLLVVADWIDDRIFQHRWTWLCHRVAESPLWEEFSTENVDI